MRPQHRRGGGGFALVLLASQLFQVGFDRIPPVTLSAILAQVVIHLKLLNLPWPSLGGVCISTVNVWYRQQWERLFLGAFFHGDEWHLYFNMVSLLWKGLTLERKYGSGYFLFMVVVFTALTNVVLVSLGVAGEYFLHDPSYLSQCAVGFSGVLFALKVVTTHLLPPGVQYVMGMFPVPSRMACWAELALIHILVPNSSFLGHLAGILVGLLYVKGPLKGLMDLVFSPGPSYTYRANATGYRAGGSTYSSGYASRGAGGGSSAGHYVNHGSRTTRAGDGGAASGSDNRRATRSQDSSSGSQDFAAYTTYTGGLSEEQQMQEALRESLLHDRRLEPSAPPPDAPESPPEYRDVPPPYSPVNQQSATGSRLYPDLPLVEPDPGRAPPYPDIPHVNPNPADRDLDEVRRRRLARFNKQDTPR